MRRTTKTRTDKYTGKLLRPGEYAKGPGKYEYRHTDETTGRTVSVYAKTLDALRRREKKLNEEGPARAARVSRKLTLDEVYDEYTRESVPRKIAAGTLRQSTADFYSRAYGDWVRGTKLGRMRMCSITRHAIENFYLDMLSQGYSARTLEVIQCRLRQVFDYAVEKRYVDANVAQGAVTQVIKQARASQAAKKGAVRRCLTAEQASLLLETMRSSDAFRHYVPIVQFLLHTGLRLGELAGLRPADIKDGAMHVQRTLAYRYDRDRSAYAYQVNPPKTAGSNRTMKLPQAALRDLEDWRAMDVGPADEACGVDDFIFCTQRYPGTRGGKPLTAGTLGHVLKNVAREANKAAGESVIPEDLSPHWLRHTFICDAIDAGIPATAVAKLVGHDSEQITMHVYYDCRPRVMEAAIDVLDELFDKQDHRLRLVA